MYKQKKKNYAACTVFKGKIVVSDGKENWTIH